MLILQTEFLRSRANLSFVKLLICFSCLSFSFNGLSQVKTFDCADRMYFFRNDSTGVNLNGTLSYIEKYNTSTPAVTDVCPMATYYHNSLGANPADQYLYYTDQTIVNRLDASCKNTPLCDLGFISYSGSFDWKGRYWIVDNRTDNLYAYDISSCNFLKGPYHLPEYVADITYNLFDCHIYLAGLSGIMYKVDTTGEVKEKYFYNPSSSDGISISGPGGISYGSDNKIYALQGLTDGSGIDGGYFARINQDKYDPDILISWNNNNGPTLNGRVDLAIFPCIRKEINARLKADKTKGCSPFRVNLNSLSSSIPYPNYRRWDFGDGSAADTVKDVTHIFWKAGTYNVKLITGLVFNCGPSYYDTTTIQIIAENDPAVLLYTPSAEVCEGADVELQAYGTGPFYWNTGETGNKISVTPFNGVVYKVTGLSASGMCRKSDSVTIHTVPKPNLYSTNQTICEGTDAELFAYGATKIVWSDGYLGTRRQVSPASDTIYSYKGYNAANCYDTASFKISVKPFDPGILSHKEVYCAGEKLELTAFCDGSCDIFWNGPNISLNHTDKLVIEHLTIYDQGTYTINIYGQDGCLKALEIYIEVLKGIELNLTSKELNVCKNEVIDFGADPYPANTPLSWSGPGSFSSSSEKIHFDKAYVNQSGVYKVQGTAGDCTIKDSISIKVNERPDSTITVVKRQICEGEAIEMSVPPGNFYSWTGPGGFPSYSNAFSIPYASLNDEGVYTVTIYNSDGCMSQNSDSVKINPKPEIKLFSPENIIICKGQKFNLDFSVSGSIADIMLNGPEGFTSAKLTNSFTNANQKQQGIYTITATGNGCTAEKQVSVIIDKGADSVIIAADDKVKICEEGQGDIRLLLSPDLNSGKITWYRTDSANAVAVSPVLHLSKPQESGIYYARVESKNQVCPPKRTNEIKTRIYQVPKAVFDPSGLITDFREGLKIPVPLRFAEAGKDTITFHGWSPSTWLENPDTLYPVIVPGPRQELIEYTLKLKTGSPGAECFASYVFSFFNRYPVIVPNVFSPNGDGLNDFWVIKGLEGYPATKVYVYNRWGNKVYENETGYKDFWDGKHNGEDMAVSTYYYILKLRGSVDNSDHELSGSVTIIR